MEALWYIFFIKLIFFKELSLTSRFLSPLLVIVSHWGSLGWEGEKNMSLGVVRWRGW